ncbi:Hypothetical protein FKW44_025316 [Caligus rogercresseyi]|uniref:Uncharacterized protein n=1 Tax=Caligus rogercresseyi TaxID=217165 RepID=A0A7T8GLK6_CALRO|nr:Hypothetical protein FKW44_025316 [Caligus rogercresseyi]
MDIEPQSNEHIKRRDRYRWQKKDFISPNTEFSGPALTDDATVLHTPLQYFEKRLGNSDHGLSLQRNACRYPRAQFCG